MNLNLAKTALLVASLCASVVASAAVAPLGKVVRLENNDATMVAHKEVVVSIKHANKAFKLKTSSINPAMMARIRLNTVVVTKGGSK